MLDSNVFIMVITGVAVLGLMFYVFKRPAKPPTPDKMATGNGNALQLQAYERLTLLVDRITLSNLISRTSHEGLSAREMQFVLTKTIRDEFDYNITQQIYVTNEIWQAVKNLKEKNLLLINQLTASLAADASGLDLNRAILDFLVKDNKTSQSELVSQALSYEAKKLL